MLNFAIVPVNYYDAILNQDWAPKAWPAVHRSLNPYADPFIDRIQLYLFNLKRQIELRAPVMIDNWLHRLGDLDECVIQAEREYYFDEILRVEIIYREYLIEHYLDREADSFDPGNLRFDPPPEPPLPLSYGIGSTLINITTNSRNPYEIEPIALRPLRSGERAKDESSRYQTSNQLMRDHIAAQMKESWEVLGPQAWLVNASFNHLLYEFAMLKDQDQLNGIAGKQRMFLINEAIHLPNRFTWLAWYSQCGLNWQGMPSNRIKDVQRLAGAPVDSILSFVLPSMPMTTEHVSGVPNPGDDSGSGHSLSSKSASHDRNLYGRILHGRWESYTVCVDTQSDAGESLPENLIIDDIPFGTTTGRSLIDSGLAMWGLPTHHPMLFPNAAGIVSDPYFRFMYRQPLHFHRDERHAFDTGMRSLAEFHNVHLRFSGNEFGALCAKEWREAFILEANRFIRKNDMQRMLDTFDAALIQQTPRANQGKKRGRKEKHDFGIDDIFGTES